MKVYVLIDWSADVDPPLFAGIYASFKAAAAVSDEWIRGKSDGVWLTPNRDYRIEEHKVQG